FRAELRQTERPHAAGAGGRAQGAGIQMRRAVGDARCASPRLCGAEAHPAGRVRTERMRRRMSGDNATVPSDARPHLPRGVRLTQNEAHGWTLLGPERVFKADAIAVEIIKRCTGEATLTEIVDDLAKSFLAPRE